MQYTTNYNLKKIELTDAPPDITQLNSNFDTIDDELAVHVGRLDAQEVREGDIWASINALGDKVTTPFCVNSGVLDSNGQPSILSYANDNNTSTELAFQQPVLTANGTMGGSAFAVSANDSAAWAWYLFSANGGEWGGQSAPSESNPTELQIYNPTPLLVRSISLKNSVTVEQIWSRVIVYGSNNGSTWTQIATGNNSIRTTGTWVDLAVNATVSYKYFKISFTGNTTGAAIAVARISLNATQTITHTGGRVTFKGSIVATTATGKTFTVGSMADIDVSKLTGREFIAFIDTAGATGVTAGTMYAQDTQPTSPASGDIWFKTLEPLACYQYLANTWRERNIVPIGEVYADGTGKITGVSTYPYNQNGYTVNTRTQATPTTFGLVRTAAPEDETNCQCDDAAITPENLYKLADYRRANTAYEIGDVVACPYHAELMLKCTTAGTTNAGALDTTNVTEGQALADGSVTWTVVATGSAGDISKYPAWYFNKGNGSDGAFNPTSDITISGEKNYTTVNIPSGVTVTVDPAVKIKCQGAFINNGAITADGKGMVGGEAGASAAGDGYTYTTKLNGQGDAGYVSHGGACGTYKGGGGGNVWGGSVAGITPIYATVDGYRSDVKTSGVLAFTLGSGGTGGGTGANEGTSKAIGGTGGGGIVIVANTVTNTGTITANGSAGAAGTKNYFSGGGGGGGGTVIVVASSINNTGTVSADGGAGGGVSNTNYASAGATGGAGFVLIEELK